MARGDWRYSAAEVDEMLRTVRHDAALSAARKMREHCVGTIRTYGSSSMQWIATRLAELDDADLAIIIGDTAVGTLPNCPSCEDGECNGNPAYKHVSKAAGEQVEP